MTVAQLFDPDAVAVVGASSTEGKIGYEAAKNLRYFDGPVYPVNPNGEGELFGDPFVDSVAETDADLALCCVPAPVVPDVIEECGEAGVGGAVIYAGGFAEAGGEGEDIQERLTATANEYDVSVLGPNTSGFLVPGKRLFASFASDVEGIEPGNVAVVSQSGGVALSTAFQAERDGNGLSAMVGLGNRANTGFEEAIDYFDDDPATEAIAIYIEGTDDARGLLETCRDADTPVVAYKVGREDVGSFAASHTGALTGDYALYDAGFRQYGVPTVDSTTQLFDAARALADSPRPEGPNVALVTAQAGPGIIVTDRLKRAGATLPELSETTRDRIEEVLPGITYSQNPVDTARPMPEFGDVITAVAEDENVDAVIVYMLYEDALGYPTEALDGLAERTGKPVVFCTDGPEHKVADELATLREAGVPAYHTPERGADALSALVHYALRNQGGEDDD